MTEESSDPSTSLLKPTAKIRDQVRTDLVVEGAGLLKALGRRSPLDYSEGVSLHKQGRLQDPKLIAQVFADSPDADGWAIYAALSCVQAGLPLTRKMIETIQDAAAERARRIRREATLADGNTDSIEAIRPIERVKLRRGRTPRAPKEKLQDLLERWTAFARRNEIMAIPAAKAWDAAAKENGFPSLAQIRGGSYLFEGSLSPKEFRSHLSTYSGLPLTPTADRPTRNLSLTA